MIKYIHFLLALILFLSCKANKTIINKHVEIEVYTHKDNGELQVSAMPKLRSGSRLVSYNRRFEYLLINVSEIHKPNKAERRKEIWSMYPDTTKLKRLYLNEYARDKRLVGYFELTSAAITNKNFEATSIFTIDELMDVASKFFYCDKVFPDTTVQTHICIGLNGVSEANWIKDYKLLEAFCYEGIFDDLIKDDSQIDESYNKIKKETCQKYRSKIITLDTYLKDIRKGLFERMKNDPVLKNKLLEYYDQNKSNLAFAIIP